MPDTAQPNFEFDEVAYPTIAEAFAERFVENILRVLFRRKRIQDVSALTPEDADLVFDLAFFGLATFEDQAGITIASDRTLAVVGFAAFGSEQPNESDLLKAGRVIISHERTGLHGSLSDELLQRAFEKAKAIVLQ